MKLLFRKSLPLLAAATAIILDIAIPDSELQPKADLPFFLYAAAVTAVIYLVCVLIGLKNRSLDKKIVKKAPLICGIILFVTAINMVTSKFALLPVLFFPSLDRVLEVYVKDHALILRCIGASGKLLITGYAIGGLIGFFTGVMIGSSRKFSYWVSPLMKFIGPIPATSWSPLVLTLLPTSYDAAVFMVALAVWFPVTLMTSSGVSNVTASYFEVSQTLGAGKIYQIIHVAVPAAMPDIFLGLFYATCGSFVTLVTAELLGADAGLGWYLNWQKSMMMYANIYAGLIVMAVLCLLVITLLFRIKDNVLIWQRGVIRW